MIDLYTLSVIGFFAIVAIGLYMDRKNIEWKYLVLFMRRTKRFRNTIDKIAKFNPILWRHFYNFGVLLGVVAMAYGTFFLVSMAYGIIQGTIDGPALSLVLPSPTQGIVSSPGVIGIPFWFWIITIGMILIPHEFSHGIAARIDKIRLKSVGLLLLAVLPGAFVEPDDKQLNKAKFGTKARIFAAGSFVNILLALIVLFAGLYLVWPAAVSDGVLINSINSTSPVATAGLQEGMVIQQIGETESKMTFADYAQLLFILPNSTNEDSTRYLSGAILHASLSTHRPGDNVIIKTDHGDFSVTLGENPQLEGFAYLGVSGSELNTRNKSYFNHILPLAAFIYLLSFAVGIINILPLKPLDGGLLFEAFAEKYTKDFSKPLVKYVSFFMLAVLLFVFVGPSLI